MPPRKSKAFPYHGIWADLVGLFGESALAGILDCSVETLQAMAQGRAAVPPGTARTLRMLAQLHGVIPCLFRYRDWKDHKNVLIASVPEGWVAWSLDHAWPNTSRWFGNPSDELSLIDKELLSLAQRNGWPYHSITLEDE